MWHIAVYRRRQHEQFTAIDSSFALCKDDYDDSWHLVDGDYLPATGSVIRMRAAGVALIVDCRGVDGAIEVESCGSFDCEVPAEMPLPALFRLDDTWIEVRPQTSDLATLALQLLYAVEHSAGDSRHGPPAPASAPGPDPATIAKWLSAASQLHRTAASSPEFFSTAARLALDSTGLDAAMILARNGDHWQIAGSAVPHPEQGISFDPAALPVVIKQPGVWRRPTPVGGGDDGQLDETDSLVVAPVRNDAGEVIAAVYGVRHGRGENRRRGVRTLEARVIELVADAVAVGMARREQEIESARQRVLLEQTFSPAIAEHLLRRPHALAGTDRDVTLLFADLRGFTSLAEGLLPAEAYELLAAVLEMFTQAIMDHDGVVIDYYGDGVCAFWNAPFEVPDHADKACAAALEMVQALPELSDHGQQLLGQSLQLGVGLHSARVQVGNAGTRRRLKYGPRGSGVNVASRVQAAAKHLDVALLATDAVRRQLSSRFVSLKVCTARLPGLEQPLDLFTVFPATNAPRLQGDLERYAAALEAFEQGDLDAAERILSRLLDAGPATPAAFLAQQTAALRQSALGRRATDEFGITPDAVIEILAK